MSAYDTPELSRALAGNTYPGRGLVVGKTPDGANAVAAYFIMGRSGNSRNRVFVEKEDGELITAPFDESRVEDPSLIIYSAIRRLDNYLIVTNGNQTNTIYNFLKQGKSFEQALMTRSFEPDEPNFTPRISALLTFSDEDFGYKLSILKRADEAATGCARYFFAYPSIAGVGSLLHTYISDGDPIPSFTGEPVRVAMSDDIDGFADMLWKSLDSDNKISLYVRYINLKTHEVLSRLVNKNI